MCKTQPRRSQPDPHMGFLAPGSPPGHGGRPVGRARGQHVRWSVLRKTKWSCAPSLRRRPPLALLRAPQKATAVT